MRESTDHQDRNPIRIRDFDARSSGQDKMDQGVVAAVETAAINRIKVRKASLLLLQAGQDMPKQISFFPIQLNF